MIPAGMFPEASLPSKDARKGDVEMIITAHARPVALKTLKPVIDAINARLVRVMGVTTEEVHGKMKRVIIEFD